MKYRAGVIGCGRIGFEFDKDPKRRYIATHTGAYNYVKDIDLAAVCDIDKKRLKGCMDRWNIPEGYSDLKEMLRKENLDILSNLHSSLYSLSYFKRSSKISLKSYLLLRNLQRKIKKQTEKIG